MRLLITSAGRRVELLQCFRADAAILGIDLDIHACDLNPEWSSACHLADKCFAVPRVDDAGYADTILEHSIRQGVSLVVPTIDPELLPLATASERFAAAGIELVASSPALIRIARDKLLTAQTLSGHDIPVPRTAAAETVRDTPEHWEWPLLLKARSGSASRGLRIARNAEALDGIENDEPLVVQDLLKGREFTINMFFDRTGALKAVIPHERIQVRAGEVEKGMTRRMPQLASIAARMAAMLPGPRGPMCFQAMVDHDGLASVFEINARFGGGYPLAHRAGARFSQWLLEEHAGIRPSAHDDWREGVRMMRYDAAVFDDRAS